VIMLTLESGYTKTSCVSGTWRMSLQVFCKNSEKLGWAVENTYETSIRVGGASAVIAPPNRSRFSKEAICAGRGAAVSVFGSRYPG
jgi:hypothetical protein